jgi:VIT1/CCC1 family predicted Fe2+/Mn2+ transporter
VCEKSLSEIVKQLQMAELTEKEIYLRIAGRLRNKKDRATLEKIAAEEQKHHDIWKRYTKVSSKPNKFIVLWYVFLARVLGYTFAIKTMENKQSTFKLIPESGLFERLKREIPDLDTIIVDEAEHEKALIELIDEEKLQYVGSMVLGLNDALVEFTGSLAGWTFAMQSNRLILLAGLITGVSATLSMASSEYLSVKSEGKGAKALKASLYTGIAYLFTVFALLLPYMLLPEALYFPALIIMLGLVIAIIAGFNFYISVAKTISFKEKFKEMSIVSLSVAGISFAIGLAVKHFLGIDL